MPKARFEAFPDCCRLILEALERDQRTGARNCPAGHMVSLDYARQIEDRLSARSAAEGQPAKN